MNKIVDTLKICQYTFFLILYKVNTIQFIYIAIESKVCI